MKKRAKTALNNGNTAIYIFKSREKRVKSVEKSVNKPGRDDSKTEAFIRVFRIDLRSDRSLDKPRCRLAAEGPAKAEKKPGALSPSHRASQYGRTTISPTTKLVNFLSSSLLGVQDLRRPSSYSENLSNCDSGLRRSCQATSAFPIGNDRAKIGAAVRTTYFQHFTPTLPR